MREISADVRVDFTGVWENGLSIAGVSEPGIAEEVDGKDSCLLSSLDDGCLANSASVSVSDDTGFSRRKPGSKPPSCILGAGSLEPRIAKRLSRNTTAVSQRSFLMPDIVVLVVVVVVAVSSKHKRGRKKRVQLSLLIDSAAVTSISSDLPSPSPTPPPPPPPPEMVLVLPSDPGAPRRIRARRTCRPRCVLATIGDADMSAVNRSIFWFLWLCSWGGQWPIVHGSSQHLGMRMTEHGKFLFSSKCFLKRNKGEEEERQRLNDKV